MTGNMSANVPRVTMCLRRDTKRLRKARFPSSDEEWSVDLGDLLSPDDFGDLLGEIFRRKEFPSKGEGDGKREGEEEIELSKEGSQT